MDMPLVSPLMMQVIIIFITLLIGTGIGLLLGRRKIKFSWKIWCLILPLPSLIALYIVFYLVCNYIGRKQIKSRLEKITTLEELVPKGIDTPDNGAFFYKAAFNIMYYSNAFREVNDIIMKKNYPYDVSYWPESDKELAKKLLLTKKEERVFELLKEGNEKPFAAYPRDYKHVDDYYSELTKQREFFRRLSVMVSCQAAAGNTSEACALIDNGFIMIKKQENDPLLIAAMVNVACTLINLDTLNLLTAKYGIDDSDAKKIINTLNTIDFNNAFIYALNGEICIYWSTFPSSIINRELKDVFSPYWTFIPFSPYNYYDYNYFLTYMSRAKTLFEEPYWTAKEKMREMRLELRKKHFIPLLSRACCWGTTASRKKSADIETEINAAKLTLALHIYKNKHGQFPEKLDELSPEILKKIPCDPFNGKPLEYKKEGNYFTLSSEWLAEKAKLNSAALAKRKH